MKRYEGLFILNTAGREEGVKDALDKISAEISAAGGKVETVQKMEKKNFSRVANKRHSAGFYVNVIFEGQPGVIDVSVDHVARKHNREHLRISAEALERWLNTRQTTSWRN